MSKPKAVKPAKDRSGVILIRDLAPRNDVIGGSGKLLFGERQEIVEEPARPGKTVERDAPRR